MTSCKKRILHFTTLANQSLCQDTGMVTQSALIPRSSPAHPKAVAKAKHPQPLLGQLEHLDHPDHLPGLQQPPPPSPGLSILRVHPRGTETRAARHSLGDGSEEGQAPWDVFYMSSKHRMAVEVQGFLLSSFESVLLTLLKPQPLSRVVTLCWKIFPFLTAMFIQLRRTRDLTWSRIKTDRINYKPSSQNLFTACSYSHHL